MKRLTPLLLVLVFASCIKPEPPDASFPVYEQSIQIAAARCNGGDMSWLRSIIQEAEQNNDYKGSIYAIPLASGTVFLHQPWVSSCFGCNLYHCDGEVVTLSEAEQNEVYAGAREENLIYTSFQ